MTAAVPAPRAAVEAVPALELRAVRAGYGRVEVLHGVDLVVAARGRVGRLGRHRGGHTPPRRVGRGGAPG